MKTYVINDAGFVENVRLISSPNFDDRPALTSKFASENLAFENPAPADISLIVIHNISLPPNQYGGAGIIELFTNQLNPDEHPYYAEIYTRKVSSHFLIRREGELIQFVSCLK
ncbi:MAG: 1,6-anhydro-N-acetylmuramyl-L-alanine amidase AmpD, partial [Methylotenera sp.]